jgi:molybdenum cofactor biosynthesis protein MoaC
MRDVSAKISSRRIATAEATVSMSPKTIRLIEKSRAPKGDPRPVAKVAAILAAKETPRLLPYCHQVALDWVHVEFEMQEAAIRVSVTVKAIDRTGVEMEALTAAAVAALNLYDLLKPVDETLEIVGVRLLEKTGGKSAFPRMPFTAGVLVVSDSVSRREASDRSGAVLQTRLDEAGGRVVWFGVVPDDTEAIAIALREMKNLVDFAFTTGGTGVGPRDVTPEAVQPLIDRPLPGIVDHILSTGCRRTPLAMLGRPVAGLMGSTVVVCLPGSPSAVDDAMDALFPYLTHARTIVLGGGHE